MRKIHDSLHISDLYILIEGAYDSISVFDEERGIFVHRGLNMSDDNHRLNSHQGYLNTKKYLLERDDYFYGSLGAVLDRLMRQVK